MVRSFFSARTPPPPAPLAAWLEGVPVSGGTTAEVLLRAGLDELDAARAAPGRVRQSAFHLLAADGLLTYACEAALEVDDPRNALVRILQQAAAYGR